MTRTRVPFARLLASFAALLTVAVLTTACGSRSRELEPGTYRAVLELPGGELPFVTATMPGYENTLTAEIRGGKLTGEVSLLRAGGERQVLPLRAEAGQAWRFFETPATDNADVAGRWSVTFTSDQGEESPGVAEFTQSFERVTGTILTPIGDHRFLAGEMRGDELYLSRFDGASAYLYKAKVDADGHLVGEYWSGKTGHQSFRAEREK